MGLTLSVNSSNTKSTFEPVPEGMHLARCYRIIDLGTQTVNVKGTEKKMKKVQLHFEVHGEDSKGNPMVTNKGEPMTISTRYTASLNEMATLRKQLESWRSRGFTEQELRSFELKNVLGAWAMITVTKKTYENGKEYTNIDNINPVPAVIKKSGLPNGFNPLVMFDFDRPELEVFNSFPESLQKVIQSSAEWESVYSMLYAQEQNAAAHSDRMFSEANDDPIPF